MDDSMIITNTWLSQENKKNKLLENVKIIIKCSMNIRTHNRQLLALWNSAGNLPQKYSNRVVFVWVILIYINLNQITISHMQPDYWLWLVHLNWHWQRIRIQRRIYFHWYRTTGAFIVYFGSEKKTMNDKTSKYIFFATFIHIPDVACLKCRFLVRAWVISANNYSPSVNIVLRVSSAYICMLQTVDCRGSMMYVWRIGGSVNEYARDSSTLWIILPQMWAILKLDYVYVRASKVS